MTGRLPRRWPMPRATARLLAHPATVLYIFTSAAIAVAFASASITSTSVSAFTT